MPHLFQLFLILALLSCAAHARPGAPKWGEKKEAAKEAEYTLTKIKDRRRAMLLVSRLQTTDVNDVAGPIQAEVDRLISEGGGPRFGRTYNIVAIRLNKYILKFHSLAAVNKIAEADFIIFFNIVEHRRILDRVYAFGELFVLVREGEDQKRSAVVWKSHKVTMADDAVKEFIKELRAARGEK